MELDGGSHAMELNGLSQKMVHCRQDVSVDGWHRPRST